MFMLRNNFIVLSVKRFFLPFIFCCFTLALIIFSKDNLDAAKSGLALWANSVLPALLPFFIATELLSHTGIIPFLGRALNGFMRPIFNVPGVGSFAFIMGIISGYPVGAKIIARFRENNLCTKEEGERLLSFTNNSSPLFIVGTVGVALIGNTILGIILLVTHILASITVGIIFRFWKSGTNITHSRAARGSGVFLSREEKTFTTPGRPTSTTGILRTQRDFENSQRVNFSNLGEVLASSIMTSINTIIMIGGFIMLFSIIILPIFQYNNICSRFNPNTALYCASCICVFMFSNT